MPTTLQGGQSVVRILAEEVNFLFRETSTPVEGPWRYYRGFFLAVKR